MRNKLPQLKLSHDEEIFLRHWIYDEIQYQKSQGRAKQLQVEHHVKAADLALLIAAAIPDPADQEAAGAGPPPSESPRWPWTDEECARRIEEARSILIDRHDHKQD